MYGHKLFPLSLWLVGPKNCFSDADFCVPYFNCAPIKYTENINTHIKQLIEASYFKGTNKNKSHPIITACLTDILNNTLYILFVFSSFWPVILFTLLSRLDTYFSQFQLSLFIIEASFSLIQTAS